MHFFKCCNEAAESVPEIYSSLFLQHTRPGDCDHHSRYDRPQPHTPGRIIPSHHSLLEVLDFSLWVSKCQMYAKLFRIQLLQFESDSLHSESVDCHKRKSLLQQNATLMLYFSIKWNFVSIQQIFSVGDVDAWKKYHFLATSTNIQSSHSCSSQ